MAKRKIYLRPEPKPPPDDDDCMVVDATGQMRSARARNNLGTLRAFRDKVLANTEHGRELIGEYVRFTPRVLLLFIRQPSLRKDAARVIEVIVPIARAMLRASTKADSAQTITAKTVDIATRFTEVLADADRKYKGGGALTKAIRARLFEINPNTLIGLSIRETRQALKI
jgi:hypothetical protein